MKRKNFKTLGIVAAIVLTTALTGCQKKEVAISSEENVVVASSVNSVSNGEAKTRLNTNQIKEALSAKAETEEIKEEVSVLVKSNNEEKQPVVVQEEKKEEAKQEDTTVKSNNQTTKQSSNQSSAKEETNTVNEAPVEQSAPAYDPVAEAQAVVDSTYDSASRVIALTNLYRAQNGLGTLSYDPTLTQIAQTRAEEIITCWSHTRPDGTNATALASEYGLSYRILGENLGEYQSSADQVCNDWMNSPGQRANMLNGSFGRIGVGIASDGEGYLYWVQIFAN